MDYFNHENGEAFCEGVKLEDIAEKVGTPVYVYSKATLHRHLNNLKSAFSEYPSQLCFAVKANSNIHLLREMALFGYGGDVVSLGEIRRCQLAGMEPQKVVFSGVGKTAAEIEAALDWGIRSINVESEFELDLITSIASKLKKTVPISLRVNPNIDAKTNPKITTGMLTTKFGISQEEAEKLGAQIKRHPYLELVGLACHIGSQIVELKPLREAAEFMAEFSMAFIKEGHPLQSINMGGGLGIRYRKESPPDLSAYSQTLIDAVKKTNLTLIIEPGRVIAGNMGVLLTQVVGVKQSPRKKFVVVDAAMNDLMRPTMYDSYHQIEAVKKSSDSERVDVVGPICESGDFFAQDRELQRVEKGDFLYIRGCGAYAATMASNYNSRLKAPEVLVEGQEYRLIRKRESYESLWKEELE